MRALRAHTVIVICCRYRIRERRIVKRNIIKIKMKVMHLAFNLMDFTKWITLNPFHIIYLLLTSRFCPPVPLLSFPQFNMTSISSGEKVKPI